MRKILQVVLLTLMSSGAVLGQQTREEYLQEQERLKRMLIMRQMDSDVYYMDIGEHLLADAKDEVAAPFHVLGGVWKRETEFPDPRQAHGQ